VTSSQVPAAAAGDDDLRLLREIDHIYEAIKMGGHVRAKNGVRTPPPRHHHQQQQQQQQVPRRYRSVRGQDAAARPRRSTATVVVENGGGGARAAPPPTHYSSAVDIYHAALQSQQQQQQLNGTRQRSALGTSASCGPGAQFTKYLTIYRKIIVSLS